MEDWPIRGVNLRRIGVDIYEFVGEEEDIEVICDLIVSIMFMESKERFTQS